jgi:hypothetical protein
VLGNMRGPETFVAREEHNGCRLPRLADTNDCSPHTDEKLLATMKDENGSDDLREPALRYRKRILNFNFQQHR